MSQAVVGKKSQRVEHVDGGTPVVRRAREPGQMPSPTTLLTDLTGHPMFIRNMRVEELVNAFPFNPELRTVTKYFPLTKSDSECKGKPLYIDEATSEHHEKILEQKRKVMKGKMYVIVTKTSQLIDVVEQLG